MRRSSYLAVAVLVTAILLLGGCDGEATNGTATSANGTVTSGVTPTTTGAASGEVVYAVGDLGSDDFDPLGLVVPFWIGVTNERWMRFQYNTEEADFYPVLAEKWEFAADYSYMDIYVRQGVQWQGGYGELTADDFEYTFAVWADANAGSSLSWWFAPPEQGGFIKSSEVIDPYHWRIYFSAVPPTTWLAEVCSNYVCVLCKKYCEEVGLDKVRQEPIGTGPWQLIEHAPGSYMKFEAFDQYWGKKPDFKYLTIKLVPEPDAQVAMLKTGEADIADIAPDKLADVKATGLQVKNLPEVNAQYAIFGGQLLSSDPKFDPEVPWASHTDEPADSDWNQRALKVRQALNLAIDRAVIRDKLLTGASTPMTTFFYPPSLAGYKSEWQDYPYDPMQAKELLKEAGYPDGFDKPITMYVDSGVSMSGPNGSGVALVIADELEALGLEVERQMIDVIAHNDMLNAHEDAWSMSVSYYPLFWSPGEWWQWTLASTALYHDAFIHPDFDKMIAAYSGAGDKSMEEQTKILQEGTDWIYNNYMFAPVAYQDRLIAMGPKVGDLSQYEVFFVGGPSALNFEFLTHGE